MRILTQFALATLLVVCDGRMMHRADSDALMFEQSATALGLVYNYAVMNGSLQAVGTAFPISLAENGEMVFNTSLPPECARDTMNRTRCMELREPINIEFDDMDGMSPFTLQSLWWNPDGHVPLGIYSVPHFDLHFYIRTSAEDLAAITPGPCQNLSPEAFALAMKPMPTGCWPTSGPSAAWANTGGSAPFMGNHLINNAGEEFLFQREANGIPTGFEYAFILGAYNGSVTFYEPMLSFDWLATNPNRCYPIEGAPANSVNPGYYPTSWCVYTDEDEGMHYVELTDFVYHVGGCSGPLAEASYLQLPPGSPPMPPQCVYDTMAAPKATAG